MRSSTRVRVDARVAAVEEQPRPHPLWDPGEGAGDVPVLQRELGSALAAIDDAVYRLVVQDDGSIDFAFLNEATTRMLGEPPPGGRDMVEWWFSRVHPDDLPVVQDDLRRTLAGESYETEYRVVRVDGQVRWTASRHHGYRDEHGRVCGAGVVRDTTERKATEEALRASEERLRSILQQFPMMVWATDRDGVITLSEGSGLVSLGFRPRELVGRSVFELYAGELAEHHRRALRGEELREQTTTMGRFFDTHYSPLRDASGDVAGMFGVSVEITERVQAERQQAALRRVATEVAAGGEPEAIFAVIARETAELLDGDLGAIVQVTTGHDPGLVAAHGEDVDVVRAVAAAAWARGEGEYAERWRTRRDALVVDTAAEPGPAARAIADRGYACVAAVPVALDGELWGVLAVASRELGGLATSDGALLTSFAELVSLALANAQARRRLQEEATTDALTGLANHRRFHEQLRVEVERAHRYGRNVSLALIDVDQFKEVNDVCGHHVGDEVLRALAGIIGRDRRTGELLARIGGDEFALLMPETDDAGALAVAERLRTHVCERPVVRDLEVTVSIGVADLSHASTVDDLLRHADGALYWSKEHGRNAAWRYSPEVADALSDRERADRLARAQSLTALRSLVRALDLRDRSTQRHSERVAALAAALAEAAGYAPGDVRRVREAALIHDVGKIAVPDEILHKPGPLTEDEWHQIRRHAELGAEIAREVLDEEQVTWIRHHHERWDGAGYPDGLASDAIPGAARIIAVADAFDVMTNARHYRHPVTPDAALATCVREAGRQLCPEAVGHLRELAEDGGLPDPAR